MQMKRLFRTLSLILFLCLLSSESGTFAKEVITIPKDVEASCEYWAEEYEICPELIEAMCWHETRCRSNLKNGNCIGITQINPNYHSAEMEELGITDLYDADQNIHLCAYMIRQYANENEDLYYVLMCWNSGSTKGKKLFDKGIYTKYAIEVTEESAKLERLHGK